MESFKQLIVPSNACLLLVVAGVLAGAVHAIRCFARPLVVTGLLSLLVLSSGWTATALLLPLERAHPSLLAQATPPPARAIVVLGAYGVPDPTLPVSSWPNGAGLFRVVEAVHLRERCDSCRVFVSGTEFTAQAMAQALVSLGVPAQDVVVDDRADTTVDSARNLAAQIENAPFHLVTSAGHMPRALMAFRALGLDPTPAPTDYRAPANVVSASWRPTPASLHLSDLAVQEYLGMFWYRLQGM